MSQYKFVKMRDPENRHDTTDVIIRFDAVTLDEMAEVFAEFLAACGFQIQDKEVIFWDKEKEEQCD